MLTAKPQGCLHNQSSKPCGDRLSNILKLTPTLATRGRYNVVRKAIAMPEIGRQAPQWRQPIKQPLLWQSTWQQAAEQGVSPSLSPPWKVALLSDGSVTRHLQLMTGQPVELDCLEQIEIGMETAGLPDNVSVVPGPRSQREVHLNVNGQVLVWASSWWNSEQISRYLGETQKPIWINLSSNRTELYREITQIYCGNSPDLERRFGRAGPFWGREYIFWHSGQPLTLIHEIFSPALEKYLGPMNAS